MGCGIGKTAMSEIKPIAVVKRGAVSDKGKSDLRKGGYLVVESDDIECVRLLHGAALPINPNVVFKVAMKTLADGKTASTFGYTLAALLGRDDPA